MEKARKQPETIQMTADQQIRQLSDRDLLDIRLDAETRYEELMKQNDKNSSEANELRQIIYSASNELARRQGKTLF